MVIIKLFPCSYFRVFSRSLSIAIAVNGHKVLSFVHVCSFFSMAIFALFLRRRNKCCERSKRSTAVVSAMKIKQFKNTEESSLFVAGDCTCGNVAGSTYSIFETCLVAVKSSYVKMKICLIQFASYSSKILQPSCLSISLRCRSMRSSAARGQGENKTRRRDA